MIIIESTKSLKQPFKVRYTSKGNNKNDAHTENLTTKRNLMQIKQQLVRKRDKIQMGKSMGAR